MPKQPKLITCKHCSAEIAASAKTCPKCGGKNKKPIYKRPWFIALMVIIVIGVIGSASGENESSNTANNTNNENTNSTAVADNGSSVAKETEAKITYTAYDVSELMDDLDSNALKATQKYKEQYVELTGKLNVIDSSGKYISITRIDDEFAFLGVQCYLKNDEQKSAVMDMTIGDTIIVKGKITDIGEILGYSLDIDEISK